MSLAGEMVTSSGKAKNITEANKINDPGGAVLPPSSFNDC